jgi:hypothetical protein
MCSTFALSRSTGTSSTTGRRAINALRAAVATASNTSEGLCIG